MAQPESETAATTRTKTADLIFHGGHIYTLADDANPTVEALAVRGEKILAVGKFEDIKQKFGGRRTEFIDLENRTLLPGFIEAHQHPVLRAGSRFIYTDVSAYHYHTADEVVRKITDDVESANPNAFQLPWLLFFGWDIELLPDLPTLSADYIDSMFGEKSKKIPIIILAQSGHSAWVNHKTFEECGITDETPHPPGGTYVKKNGVLTGQLLEEPAIASVVEKAPTKVSMLWEGIGGIRDEWRDYASRGFTTVTEIAYRPQLALDLWLSAKAALPNCPIRLALYMNGLSEEKPRIIENSKLWLAGVKFWADGSPHAGTAALDAPYLKNDMTEALSFPADYPRGKLNWDYHELYDQVKVYHDQGKQVAIHAHGERAIDQVLAIYQQLVKEGNDCRHRIEHMGLVTESQLKTCGKYGIATSFFVAHLYFYGRSFNDWILGPERTKRWTPLATAVKHVGRISIHTDNPTFPGPPLPLANIKTAVTRTQRGHTIVYGGEYCILIDEAIKAYTTGPAWQLHMEDKIGSLEEGKFADLVILSANPYEVDPMDLDNPDVIRVVETYIGGRCNNIHQY